MPQIDVIDSTWIAAPPAVLAPVVADAANWGAWWPGLQLRVSEARAEKGVRWSVPAVAGGPATGMAGSAEVWLQAMFEGTVAHFFLRLDPPAGAAVGPALRRRVERFYRERTKQAFWTLADDADRHRAARARLDTTAAAALAPPPRPPSAPARPGSL